MERVNQVILNMPDTNDLANKVFGYIDQWGETLASISCCIRASCHRTIHATLGQYVFGRVMILSLASVLYCILITSGKQQQIYIDNVQ